MKNNKDIKNKNISCRFCGGANCVKHGMIKAFNKEDINSEKQRYKCNTCKKLFSLNDRRRKHPIERIFLALILYDKGLSQRNIQKTLEETFEIKLSLNVLQQWLKTFSYLLEDYKEKNTEERRKDLNNKPRTIKILELDENKVGDMQACLQWQFTTHRSFP